MGEGTVRESGMDMDMLLLFYMENQQGPAAPLRELCSMSHSSLDGRGDWGRRDTCKHMAEALCCPLKVSQHC